MITQYEAKLHQVFSIKDAGEHGVYIVDIELTDTNGERYRAAYVSRPDDPYGLNPLIRVWLSEHPDFPVHPYEPPVPAFEPLKPINFKLGMLTLNVTPDQVDEVIEQMPEPDKMLAKIYWTSAQWFRREDPLIEDIAAVFGKTSADIDGAWLHGMALGD